MTIYDHNFNFVNFKDTPMQNLEGEQEGGRSEESDSNIRKNAHAHYCACPGSL